MPQLELDNQLCFALYDASRAVVRAYAPLLAEFGLPYPQYITMLVLWEADEAMSVGDIGRRLHLDSGTLTPLLRRLAHLGLAKRDRDPADERRMLITLTPRGRTMRGQAESIPARLAPRYGIDLEAARQLRDDLNRLVTALDAGAPPA